MTKILVLGYFGYKTDQLDGQTVKTRSVYRLLEENIGNIDHYDTQVFQYSRLSIFNMFWKICQCKQLIYLPAHNNLKWIFPIIFILSKIFRCNIHYFVVGGWLCEFIEKLPILQWMLNHICGIYCETNLLKANLERTYGFSNIETFPNFRFFNFKPHIRQIDNMLRVVFMAKVEKNRGLETIFNLCNILLNSSDNRIKIDFYGSVKENESAYFFENVNKYQFVEYKGGIVKHDISSILEMYDVMIFPTKYIDEDRSSSIEDSYIWRIPIIGTNSQYATEIVEDGKTGIIIPCENNQQQFNDAVLYLLDNPNELSKMKVYIHNKVQKNLSNTAQKTMLRMVDLKGGTQSNNESKTVEDYRNFRLFNNRLDADIDSTRNEGKLKLVFMARINKKKGLDVVFSLGDFIKRKNLINKVTITFYGPLLDEDKDYFYSNVSKYDFIKYNGVLQPEQIEQVLNKYDLFLFPTHYFTEGLPGSIVDAYISSLPVVATKWKHAEEFIDDCKSGIIIPFENGQKEFNESIEYLLNNPKELAKMKFYAHNKAKEFSADSAWKKMKMILKLN